jgi:branched-chain amino acid transport system permease protein
MIVVLPLAGLVAAFFGVLIGIPTLRLRGDYLAIVTLGFGEIIRIFANNLDFPVNLTNGPRGVYDVDPIRVGSFDFGAAHDLPFSTPAFDLGPLSSPGGPLTIPAYLNYYLLVLVLIMITVFFVSRLSTSRVGRAWAAIREDELAAEAAGIHTRNLKLLAYASGGFFGGVAGATFAAAGKFIDPTLFGFDQSIFILVLVVVGGMGTIAGVIVGSVLVVEAFYNTAQAGSLRVLIFGILLVIMIIIKPEGLLPNRQRKLELTEAKTPTDVPPTTDPLPDVYEAGA